MFLRKCLSSIGKTQLSLVAKEGTELALWEVGVSGDPKKPGVLGGTYTVGKGALGCHSWNIAARSPMGLSPQRAPSVWISCIPLSSSARGHRTLGADSWTGVGVGYDKSLSCPWTVVRT